MTREQAKQQIEAFFRRLGITASFFEDKNFAKAAIGESVIGFEFDAASGGLSARALIYRFRQKPKPVMLDAIFAEEKTAATGGGSLRFDNEEMSLFLERAFTEKISDEEFYDAVNRLAQASLVWSGQLLQKIAEKIHGAN
jgi:hypothetical protein